MKIDFSSKTIDEIKQLLHNALTIKMIEIEDQSYKHVKHAGYIPGKLHLKLTIAAQELNALTTLQAHRKIYAILAMYMQTTIHALTICIKK